MTIENGTGAAKRQADQSRWFGSAIRPSALGSQAPALLLCGRRPSTDRRVRPGCAWGSNGHTLRDSGDEALQWRRIGGCRTSHCCARGHCTFWMFVVPRVVEVIQLGLSTTCTEFLKVTSQEQLTFVEGYFNIVSPANAQPEATKILRSVVGDCEKGDMANAPVAQIVASYGLTIKNSESSAGPPTTSQVASDSSDITWNSDGSLARKSYTAFAAPSPGGSEIRYADPSSSAASYSLTVVDAATHHVVPADTFNLANDDACQIEVHGVPNDTNVSPGNSGTLQLGCLPPGTYALASINDSDVTGPTTAVGDWRFAQLVVPSSSDWNGACIRQGSPSDYPSVTCSRLGSGGGLTKLAANSTCRQVLAADEASREALVQRIHSHLTVTFGNESQTVRTIVGVLQQDCPNAPSETVETLLYGLGYYGN
jgi:hypothetical protein